MNILKILFDFFIISFFKNRKKKLGTLIVKLDGLGDTAILLNLLSNVKLIQNQSPYYLVTRKEFKPLYQKLKIFKQVYGIDFKKFNSNFFYRFKIYISINKLSIKTSINPIYSNIVNSVNDLIIYSTKSKNKIIGETYKSKSITGVIIRSFKESIYSKRIKNLSPKVVHEYNFIKKTLKGFIEFQKKPQSNIFGFKNKYIELNNYIVIAPGSNNKVKNWPIEKYKSLILLLTKKKINVVLVGSNEDGNSFKDVENKFFYNFCGKTDIDQLFDIILNSDFAIANDSSIVHISELLKVNYIAIIWKVFYGRYLPYIKKSSHKQIIISNFKNCNCSYEICDEYSGSAKCLKQIKVSHVFEQLVKNIK